MGNNETVAKPFSKAEGLGTWMKAESWQVNKQSELTPDTWRFLLSTERVAKGTE